MIMQVFSPATSLWDQQTLFVVPGPGEAPRELASRWGKLTDEGWTLVFLRWETPAELRDHLQECGRTRGLDPERIVIAGVGDGAAYALDLAGESGRPYVSASGEEPADVISTRARKSLYG